MVVDFSTPRHTPDHGFGQTDEQMDEVIMGLFSMDPYCQLAATKRFRDLIHRDDPLLPLDPLVLERGVVRRLFHALWALVNITAGSTEETQAVVDAQAVPELVKLLSSTDSRICDQATWVLANIAGESPPLCDYVLQAGALPELVAHMGRSVGSCTIKAGVWALKNLCKDSIPLTTLHWTMLSPALQILPPILELEDEGALADACSVAACLCNGPVDTTQTILASGIHGRLLRLSLHRAVDVSLPALTAIAGVTRGTTDGQTQALIDDGLLFALNAALMSTESKAIFMACFSLSNIVIGPLQHVQAAIDVGAVKNLILLATSSCAKSIKCEASWALANALGASSTEPSIALYMLAEGCLPPLIDQLRASESKAHIAAILGAILSILEATQLYSGGTNLYMKPLEEAGIALIIFNLQHNDDTEVQLLARRIMRQFFHRQTELDVQLGALNAEMATLGISRRTLELDVSLELQEGLKRLCVARRPDL